MVHNPISYFLRQKPTLASANRANFRHEQWSGIRKKVILQISVGGIAFMLWFLIWLSYLYGTVFLSANRHASFKVLAVDYDNGKVVSQALEKAYEQLKGPGFFSLKFHSPAEYPTEEDVYHAVWKGDYWASIVVTNGSSARLEAALQGGKAATTYNPADALHYTWNQQYYTTFANSFVLTPMTQLVAATRLAYNHINGTQASHSLNSADPEAVQVLLNPIQATARNVKVASFGSSVFFNTASMVMPVLQQFFFLLVLNGVLGAHKLYGKMTVRSSMLFRRVAGIIFSLGAALCQTGYYWAFRENWQVNGSQFVMTWMTLWLLMHIHLLVFDSIATLAPLPVMPFVVLCWILLNISSTVSPLEVQAPFYHWQVALPSLEAYSILMTIWSGGAHNRLYRALPVLFAWWVLANMTTSVAHIRACHLAYQSGEDKSVDTEAEKDVERGSTAEETSDHVSVPDTLVPTTGRLDRQRTIEEVALEHRQVYGPSIPPLA